MDLRAPDQIAEIWHFFQIYKALEPGKMTETRGWERSKDAVAALEAARRRFREPRSTG